jgi:hypothetical protein
MMRDDFAGELLLALATEGRLVVDRARADQLIADVESTLAELHRRLGLLDRWWRGPAPTLDAVPADLAGTLVDALFADQIAPGRQQRAVQELPKYVAALKVARRNAAPPGGAGPTGR